MERALGLSENWKIRLSLVEKDFIRLIQILKIQVENTVEENSNAEEVENMMDNIFRIQDYINEINDIMMKINRYPLPHSVVKRISEFENEYYSIVMTKDILQELTDQLSTEERLEHAMHDVIQGIDRMWDENKSEDEIKEYMTNILKEFYPRHSPTQLQAVINNMYHLLTHMKPVRVTLSENQIERLKRETVNGTCGVCLENFSENEEGIILKCSHSYHSNCIIPWLHLSIRCPTCRFDLRE